MPLIPQEVLPKFENMIYLPMLIIMLKKDRASIDKELLKLKKPYLELIDGALKISRRTKRNHSLPSTKQNESDQG